MRLRTRLWITVLVTLFVAPLALSQGLPIKDGNSSTLAEVNSNNALEVSVTRSTLATYTASSSALATTANYSLSIESSGSAGFTLQNFCVGWTSATAAAGITISVNRRTTASSGGTALTTEGTGADSVSKHDPNDASFGGVARRTGTLGTVGATLFQAGLMVGEIGAGTADVLSGGPFCYDITNGGTRKGISVASGTANGLSILVTAPGAGGLSFGSISATFTVP